MGSKILTLGFPLLCLYAISFQPAPVIPTLATLDLPGVSTKGPIAFFNASLVKATVTTATTWNRNEMHLGNLPDHLCTSSNHRPAPHLLPSTCYQPPTSAPSAAPATGGAAWGGASPFPHQPQHSHTVH